MQSNRTALTLVSLAALLAAGCTGADELTATTGTAGPSVTSTPAAGETPTSQEPTKDPTSQDLTEAPTTQNPPGDTGEESTTQGQPVEDPTDNLAVAEGSGCTPGEGPLPDGQWYGEVSSADPDPDTVELDLMCFYLGEQADKAALEDGEAMVPVPNGYYVRNDDPTLRTAAVATGIQVLHYPTGDPATARALDFVDWAGLVEAGEVILTGVWLTVDDGEVVAVEEQWTP